MGIDLRRCAEAAVHAALAEAFVAPDPRRSGQRRRRRPRPLWALLRIVRGLMAAVRALLVVVGLVSVVRVTRDPQRRAELLDTLATRFPVRELLDEIALELASARAAMSDQPPAPEQGEPEEEPAERAGAEPAGDKRPRRPVNRRRGDSNGQGGHKPPSRGKRAA